MLRAVESAIEIIRSHLMRSDLIGNAIEKNDRQSLFVQLFQVRQVGGFIA